MSDYPLTVVLIGQEGQKDLAVYPIEDRAKFSAMLKAKRLYRQQYPSAEVRYVGTLPGYFDLEREEIMVQGPERGYLSRDISLEDYLHPPWDDPYDWVTTCWIGPGYYQWKLDFVRDLIENDLEDRHAV